MTYQKVKKHTLMGNACEWVKKKNSFCSIPAGLLSMGIDISRRYGYHFLHPNCSRSCGCCRSGLKQSPRYCNLFSYLYLVNWKSALISLSDVDYKRQTYCELHKSCAFFLVIAEEHA